MSNKANIFDKILISLFYLNILIYFFYNCLSQSNTQGESGVPTVVLALPFGICAIQIISVLLRGSMRIDSLGKSWLFILFYYIFALFLGIGDTHPLNYHTVWLIVCPPITWLYFSAVLQKDSSLAEYLIRISFWVFLSLSFICLFFIPRSIRDNGLYAYLNTGYYVLFAYPIVMLGEKRLYKIVATVLVTFIVILSMKRGGIVAMAVGYISYLLLSSGNSVLRKAFITIAAVALLAYSLPKINDYTNGTLLSRYEFTQNQGDEDGRAMMYPIVWKASWSSPLLNVVFGHGHNAVIDDNVLLGTAAHNDYLEFLYDYGIIGVVLLLIYQYRLFVITKKSYKNYKLFFPTVFSFSCIIVLSMVSIVYSFYYFLLAIPFWCVTNRKVNT